MKGARGWLVLLAAILLTERLFQITQPVLVITGDDDRIVPTEQSLRLAAELPQAELSVLPNCGHLPQEECPQAFLLQVDRFMVGLASTSSQ